MDVCAGSRPYRSGRSARPQSKYLARGSGSARSGLHGCGHQVPLSHTGEEFSMLSEVASEYVWPSDFGPHQAPSLDVIAPHIFELTGRGDHQDLQPAVCSSSAITASATAWISDDTMIYLGVRDAMQGIARHGHSMVLLALLLLLDVDITTRGLLTTAVPNLSTYHCFGSQLCTRTYDTAVPYEYDISPKQT